jgi:hypothetical protein
MTRIWAVFFTVGCLVAAGRLTGAPGPREVGPASASEHVAVERFLAGLEKPPVAYRARRRLEASSIKLKESAWMDVLTEFDPATGFRASVIAQGGSERIIRRVLKKVLQAERENSSIEERQKGSLSCDNYIFEFSGRAGDGMLRMRLTPRRRDERLVSGSAIVTAASGDLVRVEGRLSKSPSFWVRWVDVSRTYSPVGGRLMPVAIESTADVRIAGMATFSMTYDYDMVDGQAVNGTSPPELLVER